MKVWPDGLPTLTADEALPFAPQRVLVCGVTGVGKSTLARRLAVLWDLEYTELDSLFHGPEWTARPSFKADARAVASSARWVSEWAYFSKGVGQLLAERAQLVVWLDLPRRIALPRLIRRTLRRRLHREILWNGNVERPLHTFITSREHILRWEMATHRKWRERMPALVETYPHLTIVRIRHPRELERWLEGPASNAIRGGG